MSPSSRRSLTRPNTIADAADDLGLQPRQGRRLAAEGLLGRLRKPTRAEVEKFGIAPSARIVCDMGVVTRLRKRLENELASVVYAELRTKRRSRR